MTWRILEGDCRYRLHDLEPRSVQACVTSPPYYALRDYGHDHQIGQEAASEDYVQELVRVFRAVHRVLADDGTLWLNLGDSYGPGKRLLGVPWRAALALQDDGWILRSDVIWAKPNATPEGVTDRPSRVHEYLFLLSKTPAYYYDADAIAEPVSEDRAPSRKAKFTGAGHAALRPNGKPYDGTATTRNRRSVWTVATQPFAGAHFATFPPKLIEPCILAGSREGDTVLDPFSGAGTTGMVALRHGRSYVGCELNAEYAEMSRWRLRDDAPLLNTGLEAAA